METAFNGFGKEINLGTKHCILHRLDYEAVGYVIGKKTVERQCPECSAESTEKNREIRLETEALEKQKKVSSKFQSSGIPPRYTTRTFENFKCKNLSQTNALGMVTEYYLNIDKKMNTGAGLILSGKPGTGKTHLACAVGSKYLSRGSVLFVSVASMIRRIRSSYRRDSSLSEQDVIDSYRDIDLLIIDEIGIQKGSESEEHLLFEVINERYAYYKPTILVSNLNAKEIKDFIGERTLDRMREGGGQFVVFDWDSYRRNVAGDDSLPNLDGAAYKQNSKTKVAI